MTQVTKSEFISLYVASIEQAYLKRVELDRQYHKTDDLVIVLCIPLSMTNDQFVFKFEHQLIQKTLYFFKEDEFYVFINIFVEYKEEKPSDDELLQYADECWSVLFNEQQTGEREFPFMLVEG